MKTILFVCTGNVCRSPMAEGIFRQAVKGRGNYRVLSAGLGALEGQPPSAYAVQAVKELGIDISGQRSRMLTPEMVQQADYIFGMTHSHIDTVMLLYPQAANRVANVLLEQVERLVEFAQQESFLGGLRVQQHHRINVAMSHPEDVIGLLDHFRREHPAALARDINAQFLHRL